MVRGLPSSSRVAGQLRPEGDGAGRISLSARKYPGLPTDAIAGKLCDLAETYAAVAGGLSGAATSAAVLSAGVALPAAITGMMAEVLYTVRLQLRLAYDLHLVYGMPLDANDRVTHI